MALNPLVRNFPGCVSCLLATRAPTPEPRQTPPPHGATRAHSSAVAPVVNTSSISTMRLPATLRPRRSAKAPRTLRARASGLINPCDGVRRRRTSQSAATGGPPAPWIAWASSAD
jgi:hypothetical protein